MEEGSIAVAEADPKIKIPVAWWPPPPCRPGPGNQIPLARLTSENTTPPARRGGGGAVAALIRHGAVTHHTAAPLEHLNLPVCTDRTRNLRAPPSSRRLSGGRRRREPSGSPADTGRTAVASLFAFWSQRRKPSQLRWFSILRSSLDLMGLYWVCESLFY